MRYCNRHALNNKLEKIVYTIISVQDGQEFDLCEDCYLEFMEWINSAPKQKRRRRESMPDNLVKFSKE